MHVKWTRTAFLSLREPLKMQWMIYQENLPYKKNRHHDPTPKNEKGFNKMLKPFSIVAGVTRLELAASCVTGKRSNQLNYTPECHFFWWAMQGLNLRLQPCKGCTLPTELIAQKQRGYNNKQKWCQALNPLILLFSSSPKNTKGFFTPHLATHAY